MSQREIRTVYKSVRLAVSESSEAGNYDFCYQIGRQTFRAIERCRLVSKIERQFEIQTVIQYL
jgi:hypothetical protein